MFLAKEAIEEAQTSAIALGSKRKAEMDEKEAKKLEKKKKKKWYEASSGQGSTHQCRSVIGPVPVGAPTKQCVDPWFR